jgi:hypothetical protein
VSEFARFCGWCGKALDGRAEELKQTGAEVSHGICEPCEAEENKCIDALLEATK